ncbi:MAG: hypothetical protein HYS35_08195 [Betaproteobacteria bacterium]|nr:hypothetical protein [Betaproteobacteria bacterium]
MRPLVAPDSDEEREAVVAAFRVNGIGYRETPPSLFSRAKLWVDEADYEQARQIRYSIDAGFAERARAQWEKEWRERYGGSYARWLLERVRSPDILLKIVLLIAALALFAGYPIYIVLNQ